MRTDSQNRADNFLRLIRKSRRGKLKIYFGYSPGVGKTYQMLEEGHRLTNEGLDVVIGLLETHGRYEISELAKGLELIPRRRVEYRGHLLEEMNAEAIITRKPDIALIDELAHTNVPGSCNTKRYEDVQEILSEGINVISTLNVQHLESLYNTVEKEVHVKVRERLPDWVVSDADEIVNVDLTPKDLLERLKEGKIYPEERIESASANFFRNANLQKLRELTLREVASQIDHRMRDESTEHIDPTPDQVMVCLSSRGPNSEMLLRYASRLAGRLNRNWYAVYVQTPSESPTAIDVHTQQLLSGTLTLAKQLGAIVFTYKGENVSDTILSFAEEYRVGHIVMGYPGKIPLWKRLFGKKSLVDDIIQESKGLTVVLLDTRPAHHDVFSNTKLPEIEPTGASFAKRISLGTMISARRILIWQKTVNKDLVLKSLVEITSKDVEACDSEDILRKIKKREEQGSTFFFDQNTAIPHVRVEGISSPLITIGLTKNGIQENSEIHDIRAVFLIFSPIHLPDSQIEVLSYLSKIIKDRKFLESLFQSSNSEEVLSLLLALETLNR